MECGLHFPHSVKKKDSQRPVVRNLSSFLTDVIRNLLWLVFTLMINSSYFLIIAPGLQYLHTDCNPRIIHRDVKSNNILLDENMVAKVADFGISKQAPEGVFSGVDTLLKGTVGYLDLAYEIDLIYALYSFSFSNSSSSSFSNSLLSLIIVRKGSGEGNIDLPSLSQCNPRDCGSTEIQPI